MNAKVALSLLAVVVAALLTTAMLFTAGWTHPPVLTSQNGYRGTAMEQVRDPAVERVLKLANTLPDPIDKASPDGDRATAVYKNVQVLTDLSVEQFNRVMLSISTWIAPNQGCTYCHNLENMADDSLYTKKVARRMLQMTRHINQDWQQHVAATGVTCYTCHRGQPVPANIWYHNPGGPHAGGFASTNHGFGHPDHANGSTAMSVDPFSAYLEGDSQIRFISTEALPISGKGASIQNAEQTYPLMIHMSEALGVNCTYCHNSRAFYDWSQSTPQRVTAYYGIRMVRELNTGYLDSLNGIFPPNRLGMTGDVPKINCATCHNGVYKPFYGLSMAKDYPELGGIAAK